MKLAVQESLPQLRQEDGRAAPSYRHLRRIHIYDGKPYSLMSIHIDQRIFLKKPHRFRTEGRIATLLELGRPTVSKARQILTIRTADVETANHLGIAINAPVAEIRRVLCVENGAVIYFGELTYRGDFVRVDMDLMA
jgi:GntR family transcriptional regulator